VTLRWIALGAYAGMSVVTFALFAWDKGRAVRGGRRVPESTLHLFELLGGWPGALAGQSVLRHKSVKLSYRLVLWAIVALHAACWIAYLNRR
jgi:uncharacterized membrane protein YsdA (DUF1294 family)